MSKPSPDDRREEIEAHLAMRAEREGIDPTAARRRFGNVLQTQEAMRRAWIPALWDTLAQDARYVWRSWRRHPAFALSAVAVLALGLGTATTLFAALDRILFRDLPYQEPDRLVSVGLLSPLDANEIMLDGDYVQLWRPAPEPFVSVTTITAGAPVCDLTEDRPERLNCQAVETNLLQVLSVRVAAGRDFVAGDSAPGPPRVALIRQELAVRRFGSAANAVGRTMTLDERRIEIVGVLPPAFELPNLDGAEVLLPQWLAPYNPQVSGRTRVLRAYGRLKAGVTPRQAQAALQPVLAGMLENVPAQFRGEVSLTVRSLRERQMGSARRGAWLLAGAAGLLLLITCVNVTNLLLARMAARQRDFAVQAALGAGRLRLARLALTESLLLAISGCGAGLLLAAGLLKVFVALAPGGIPKIEQAAVDWRVAGAGVLLSVAAGIAVGLWPMTAALRTSLLHGTRTTTALRPWARFGMVAAQIALTVSLLGSATLLLRSLWRLASTPLGYETQQIIVAPLTLSATKYPDAAQRAAVFEQILERARQTPGAVSVALSDSLPPFGATDAMIYANMTVEGRPPVDQGTGGMVPWRSVTPGYFATLQVPLVRGRDFRGSDQETQAAGMILNESLARKMFPGEDPVGKRVGVGRLMPAWYTVVGVVRDARDRGAQNPVEPEYFLARRGGVAPQARSAFLVLRTSVGEGITAAYLRQEIAAVDPQIPVEMQTMQQRVDQIANRPRFVAWLLSAFAGLALLLAAMGLYGVASYLVTQRTRDIGVRMALGAAPGDIARQLAGEAGRWIIAGAVCGGALAWVAVRALASELYEVTPGDPWSWGAAIGALGVALVAAMVRPATRAARVDPMVALREE